MDQHHRSLRTHGTNPRIAHGPRRAAKCRKFIDAQNESQGNTVHNHVLRQKGRDEQMTSIPTLGLLFPKIGKISPKMDGAN